VNTPPPPARPGRREDPSQQLARVVSEQRARLLRVHRGALRADDLEDCYAQATLELVYRLRHGPPFHSAQHIQHALTQKLRSRINDRQRAIAGRSPITHALERAATLHDLPTVLAAREDTPTQALARHELAQIRSASAQLRPRAQQLLAGAQIGLSTGQLAQVLDLPTETARKALQRARAQTLALVRDPDRSAPQRTAPGYLQRALGARPIEPAGARRWERAAQAIERYRHAHHISDPERALGAPPNLDAPAGQRAEYRVAQRTIEQARGHDHQRGRAR
jgi:DNA-directed RNA polymerase specialized sigma24 family protein